MDISEGLISKKHSFSPQERLHRSSEYKKFWQNSKIYRIPCCLVFVQPGTGEKGRMGVTIKAKATSPQRNAVKRVIREFFRQNKELLGNDEYHFVISGQTKLAHPFPEKLRESLWVRLVSELSKNGNLKKTPH